jgi:hypothetical protein
LIKYWTMTLPPRWQCHGSVLYQAVRPLLYLRGFKWKERSFLYVWVSFVLVVSCRATGRCLGSSLMQEDVFLTYFCMFTRFSTIVLWLVGLGPFYSFHVTELWSCFVFCVASYGRHCYVARVILFIDLSQRGHEPLMVCEPLKLALGL